MEKKASKLEKLGNKSARKECKMVRKGNTSVTKANKKEKLESRLVKLGCTLAR